MKFGVIVFPGSNCDHDAYHVISKHFVLHLKSAHNPHTRP
jgi:phosphoribosylformylglycinamidine (FGAM) synthase-like amidotransferase family enzyme